jgi:acyl-CoA reductase-like NAD-dependent aldehyde dehydrogenase
VVDLSPTARGKLMRKLADLLIAKSDRLAEIEQRDNGKLAAEVVAQVKYMADYFHYYAGLADKVQSHVIPTDKAGVFAYTGTRPRASSHHHAVELAADPDQLEAGAGAGGRLHGGDQALGIHLGLDGRVRRAVHEAGFPKGVVNVVTGFGQEVGEPLVTHPDVPHIGFTGGAIAGQQDLRAGRAQLEDRDAGAGRQVAQHRVRRRRPRPGRQRRGVRHLRGHRPELPGRLAPAAAGSIHDAFVEKLIAFMRRQAGRPGLCPTPRSARSPPSRSSTRSWATSRSPRPRARTCVLGGKARPDLGAGQFVEPTIFTDVRNDMRIAQEEVFGPVLAVIPSRTRPTRSASATTSPTAWPPRSGPSDLKRAMQMTDKLKAGTVWVNNYRATSFTSPFGGYKDSGIGRESGMEAMREYLDVKCVWISSDLDVPNPFIRR